MTMGLHQLLSSGTPAFQCGLKRGVRTLSHRASFIGLDRNISHDTTLSGSSAFLAINHDKAPLVNANFNKINTTRQYHSSTKLYKPRQQDLFTPSPFQKFSRINISNKFSIHRDLKEGPKNVYGIRRYLLLPRIEDVTLRDEEYSQKSIVASINANRNVLFGAQLHIHPEASNSEDEEKEYLSSYMAACGALLDIAKEDASINGQQVQALATLNGLCSWVKECLDNDGEGSTVLTGLIHGTQQNQILQTKKKGERPPPGKRAGQTIRNASAGLILKKESDRIQTLEAVRAIATGIPRPGHSVVGAGTYRDGMQGWIALAREYTNLATNDEALSLDASYVGRRGLEEVALYKSREGEVTKIEHLAHTEEGYLREAGGAMARFYFV